MFNNLKIEIELKSPVVFGKNPLQFDSLIYWAMMLVLSDEHKVIELMDSILKRTDDVYHASQAECPFGYETIQMGRSRSNSVLRNINIPMDLSNDDQTLNLNTISHFQAFQMKQLDFYCVGNKELIENILQYLNGIGRFANAGYGQIKSIKVLEIDEDLSLVKNGQLNRILPVSFLNKHNISPPEKPYPRRVRYTVPYTNSRTDHCFIPFTKLISEKCKNDRKI